MTASFFQYTDTGPRADNQDAIQVISSNGVVKACLADGVGGANCGSTASNTSVQYFLDAIAKEPSDLSAALLATHERIKQLQAENSDCSGMATTFTACVVDGNNLTGVHVGDSRLCILRGNGLKQLTHSHTEVERLFVEGQISREQMETYSRRNVLESALGIKGDLLVHNFEFVLAPGDRLLFTSDGVHDLISKVEFRDMSKQSTDVTEYGKLIVAKLFTLQLTDNASFIVIEFE